VAVAVFSAPDPVGRTGRQDRLRFFYRVFGIVLGSEFPVDCLVPGTPPAQAGVYLGPVPLRLDNPVLEAEGHQTAPGELLFRVEGVAGFHVSGGSRIVVDTGGSAPGEDVLLFLLGTAMGALLFQRGILPLHAGAVDVGGRAVLVAGESGAGKSTLARVLAGRGYPLLTDDIAALEVQPGGVPLIHPGYPQQKLWQDTLDHLGVEADPESLVRVMDTLNKYAVPARDLFSARPLPVDRIYEIRPWDGKALGMETITGAAKAGLIMGNTYRSFLVRGLGIAGPYMDRCAALAGAVGAFRIHRPRDRFCAREMADLVLNHGTG
jgi:hypothetical protein